MRLSSNLSKSQLSGFMRSSTRYTGLMTSFKISRPSSSTALSPCRTNSESETRNLRQGRRRLAKVVRVVRANQKRKTKLYHSSIMRQTQLIRLRSAPQPLRLAHFQVDEIWIKEVCQTPALANTKENQSILKVFSLGFFEHIVDQT